jgi:hypothetical protein
VNTYEDALEELLQGKVILPQELFEAAQKLVEKNEQLGYVTVEEFIEDSIRIQLQRLSPKETFKEARTDDQE